MHIAIDARIISTTTGRYVERLVTYLDQLDSPHDYTILVLEKDKDYWKPTKPNFKVVVADFKQYSFQEQLGFGRFLRQLKPDLVHFCMPQQPLLYTGPTITTVHDLTLLHIKENDDMSSSTLRFKQLVFRSLLHRVIARSDRIITPTKFTADDVMAFHKIPADRITVTYESADIISSKPKVVSKYKNVPFLLMVGRTETFKNHRGAIEAMQAMLWRDPKLRMVVVGKRDQSSYDLENWVLTNGYRNIDFFGFASDDQLAWLYNNCRGYIFASYMEGFGLPGLEAMKHGAPVAASNSSCLPEVYGKAAVYFNPDDVAEMSEVMGKLLNNKDLRKQLIAAGHKRADQYSWQRMAKQTLTIYDEVLKKKQRK
jgi:glycosyltransferase involved in cell wall biosynthesis